MRIVFLILFCLSFSFSYGQKTAGDKVNPDFHLYLLVGQSNMAGRGVVDSASIINNPKILMLNKAGEWVEAKDPVHFDRPKIAGVGPGLRFAQEMSKANKKIKIGLIPCAVGGSPIEAWMPGAEFLSDHPYDDAIARLRVAMKSGVLKGILWHQGEGNSSQEKAQRYLGQLKEVIRNFRTEAGNERLPFVAGELGYYRENYKRVNKVLQDLPTEVPNTDFASAKGLTHKGDGTHLDARSARILGERFAVKMQGLLKQDNKKSIKSRKKKQ